MTPPVPENSSRSLSLEIEEDAVEKLRALAEQNDLPLDAVIRGAIRHGLPLLQNSPAMISEPASPSE